MKKRAEKKSVKDFEKRLKQEKADDLEVELCLIKKNLVTCISRLKLTKLHVLKKKNIHTLYSDHQLFLALIAFQNLLQISSLLFFSFFQTKMTLKISLVLYLKI
jgi:hypothetical protein